MWQSIFHLQMGSKVLRSGLLINDERILCVGEVGLNWPVKSFVGTRILVEGLFHFVLGVIYYRTDRTAHMWKPSRNLMDVIAVEAMLPH